MPEEVVVLVLCTNLFLTMTTMSGLVCSLSERKQALCPASRNMLRDNAALQCHVDLVMRVMLQDKMSPSVPGP